MSLEFEDGKTDQEGEDSYGYRSYCHCQPGVERVSGGKDSGGISSQSEEGSMSQRNLSGETQQEVQGNCQHCMNADEDEDVHQVPPLEDERGNHYNRC